MWISKYFNELKSASYCNYAFLNMVSFSLWKYWGSISLSYKMNNIVHNIKQFSKIYLSKICFHRDRYSKLNSYHTEKNLKYNYLCIHLLIMSKLNFFFAKFKSILRIFSNRYCQTHGIHELPTFTAFFYFFNIFGVRNKANIIYFSETFWKISFSPCHLYILHKTIHY